MRQIKCSELFATHSVVNVLSNKSTDKLVWRITQTIERKLVIKWLWSKTCLQTGMVNEKITPPTIIHLSISVKNLMCKCYQHNDITTCYITQLLIMIIIYWEHITRNYHHNYWFSYQPENFYTIFLHCRNILLWLDHHHICGTINNIQEDESFFRLFSMKTHGLLDECSFSIPCKFHLCTGWNIKSWKP